MEENTTNYGETMEPENQNFEVCYIEESKSPSKGSILLIGAIGGALGYGASKLVGAIKRKRSQKKALNEINEAFSESDNQDEVG